jgi:hypothetical protein
MIAARRTAVLALAGIRPPLAIALAGEVALGEFLVRPARRTGAAFAAGWSITPAAGIVVFVVIAGHDGVSLWNRVENAERLAEAVNRALIRAALSRKTGIHFC